MKKLLILLASLLLVAGMVLAGTGCATSSKTGDELNTIPSFLRYAGLQGKIMDAITGDAISADDLKDMKIYLIRGTEQLEPDKLVKGADDPLRGEYAFDSAIPVGIDTTTNALVVKLVVESTNYQRFESNIRFNAALVAGTAGLGITDIQDMDIVYTNEIFNMIGDIYLHIFQARSITRFPPIALYFSLLAYHLSQEEVEDLVGRLSIPKTIAQVIRDTLLIKEMLPSLAYPELSPSAIYRLLEGHRPPSILANALASDSALPRQRLHLYLDKLRYVKISLDGEALQQMGLSPGPRLGEILRALHEAKLDQKLKTREEEEELVRQLVRG